jgi:hypothetical protein
MSPDIRAGAFGVSDCRANPYSPSAVDISARSWSSSVGTPPTGGDETGVVVHRHHRLQVRLELRLGAAGPHDHPDAVPEQPDGVHRRLLEREVGVAHRAAQQRGRGVRAQPCHRVGDQGEVVHPYGQLPGHEQPVLGGQLVEPVEQRAPVGLQLHRQQGYRQRRRDAVLVVDDRRRHRVAQRLLVAVDQRRLLGARPHDPLEPGRRLGGPHPVRRGDHVHQRAADQGRRVRATHPPPQQPVGEQGTHLVARQLPAAADHRAAVGVGVLRDRDVGPHALGHPDQQVDRARLLRVREGHRRERGVGGVLLGHAHRFGQPGGGEHGPRRLGAHAVHRGVRHDEVTPRRHA